MKTQERSLAKEFYMRGLTQKEVAARVGVMERTVGKWVKKYGWRIERDARINSDGGRIEALKIIIGKLSDQRLSILQQSEKCSDPEGVVKLNKRGLQIAAEIANYNKALENLQGRNRVSLAVYIDVMEDIFNALRDHDAKKYMGLLDFQEKHLASVAVKYQ